MVLLRQTECQRVLPRLLQTIKSLFVQYCAHKFDNCSLKNWTTVCQYCTIMYKHITQPIVDVFIDYTGETLRHPPYSPDLSLPDFDLFPKLKKLLCETCFGSLNKLPLTLTGEICHLNKERL